MNSAAAYSQIKKWAAGFKLTINDAEDPATRVMELANAVAHLRLSKWDMPSEPDYGAVRTLMLDYFVFDKSQDPGGEDEAKRIGTALESLITAAAQKKVLASENQPYFGCHRTADSRPPESHQNPPPVS